MFCICTYGDNTIKEKDKSIHSDMNPKRGYGEKTHSYQERALGNYTRYS